MEKKFDKIYIEITNICNLSCAFCPQGKREKEFMTVEKFKHILEQIKFNTNLIMLHVKGEPLLHTNLEQILKQCEESGLKVNITTNGTLLKDKLTILMNARALMQVNISLHSYTQNKKIQNNYLKDVYESVNKLKEKIYISYRLWNLKTFKENIENKEILEFLSENYKMPHLIEDARNNTFLKLEDNVFLNQDKQFVWPQNGGKEYGKYGTCYGLRKQIAILVNGDVVPCCMDSEGELKLGNIFEQTLDEILTNQYAKNIVQGFQRREFVEPFCRTCGFAKHIMNKSTRELQNKEN